MMKHSQFWYHFGNTALSVECAAHTMKKKLSFESTRRSSLQTEAVNHWRVYNFIKKTLAGGNLHDGTQRSTTDDCGVDVVLGGQRERSRQGQTSRQQRPQKNKSDRLMMCGERLSPTVWWQERQHLQTVAQEMRRLAFLATRGTRRREQEEISASSERCHTLNSQRERAGTWWSNGSRNAALGNAKAVNKHQRI